MYSVKNNQNYNEFKNKKAIRRSSPCWLTYYWATWAVVGRRAFCFVDPTLTSHLRSASQHTDVTRDLRVSVSRKSLTWCNCGSVRCHNVLRLVVRFSFFCLAFLFGVWIWWYGIPFRFSVLVFDGSVCRSGLVVWFSLSVWPFSSYFRLVAPFGGSVCRFGLVFWFVVPVSSFGLPFDSGVPVFRFVFMPFLSLNIGYCLYQARSAVRCCASRITR